MPKGTFDCAQSLGYIPFLEDFDPALIIDIPGLRGNFPLWLSAEPQIKLQRLHEQGKCRDCIPSVLIGHDEDRVYHGLSFIRIDENRGVSVTTSMRSQRFPVLESEVLDEILPFLLHEKLMDAINGIEETESSEELAARANGFLNYFTMCRYSVM